MREPCTFTDTVTGTTTERLGLAEAFSHLREGDQGSRIKPLYP
jgi:hypothetical protein